MAEVERKFTRIFTQAKHESPQQSLAEMRTLAPVAEKYAADFGYSTRAAWAAASVDNPRLSPPLKAPISAPISPPAPSH